MLFLETFWLINGCADEELSVPAVNGSRVAGDRGEKDAETRVSARRGGCTDRPDWTRYPGSDGSRRVGRTSSALMQCSYPPRQEAPDQRLFGVSILSWTMKNKKER